MLTEEILNDKNAIKDLVENNKKFIKGMKFAIDGVCNFFKLQNKIKN